MKRRFFIKKTGQGLLAVSTISITGAILSSCSNNDDDDTFFDDGYYDEGYYGDGYYDDGYYDDGYYDDGYYDDGYYDDGYYNDGYYGDAQELTDTLLNGPWFVQTYIDSGSNQTGTYAGYSVNFNTGNEVVASNGSNTNNGVWLVSSNGQELDLAFSGSPFDEFNDEWDIFSVEPNRVEVRDVSGGGGGTDILVFEKL